MKNSRKIGNTNIRTFEDELDYCLARPEIFIGSISEIDRKEFIYVDGKLSEEMVTINPGLYKIFVEALDNCIDEAIRTDFKHATKINVFYDNGKITICDYGRGVPTDFDDTSGKYTPELIYTSLRTGSNFDDTSESETIGKNGVGVSLTNFFSKEFSCWIDDGKNVYKQKFSNNSKDLSKPSIKKTNGKKTFTEISFTPDYEYFKVTDKCKTDFERLIHKRVSNLAWCYPEITFRYNKKIVRVGKEHFNDVDENMAYISNEKVNIVAGYSEEDVRMGFVNGSACTGNHVVYVRDTVQREMRAFFKKKYKIDVSPSDLCAHLFIGVSIRMPKPKFDSQTKERMTSPIVEFKHIINGLLDDKRFRNKILSNPKLIDTIKEKYLNKVDNAAKKKLASLQKKKIKKVAKFIPAQSKKKDDNILVLTEGDSAINSLITTRPPNIAGYPLRGKVMNVHSETPLKVLSNNELKTIMDLVGLEIGKKPKNLNFGKIAIMADADVDGNAITGLLINFFWKFWPELITDGKILRILPPLYSVKKGKTTKTLYTFEEHRDWVDTVPDIENYSISYFKGLGSLSEDLYEKMINKPKYITFEPGKNASKSLELVYGKNADKRKQWLSEVT